VPACIALYYRLTIPETPRYTFDVARDTEKAKEDVEAYSRYSLDYLFLFQIAFRAKVIPYAYTCARSWVHPRLPQASYKRSNTESHFSIVTGKHEGNPDAVDRAQGLKDSEGLLIPKASLRDFFHFYGQWKNGRILLGTAGSWFMLDVAFYGLNLNTSTVLQAIGYGTGPTVYKVSKASELFPLIPEQSASPKPNSSLERLSWTNPA
jgi:PHS family inorganic phosphate transporter-like MFS transporter